MFSIEYKINYKNILKENQYKAVTSLVGVHRVIAGAGTGKTHTLSHRMAYIYRI